MSHEVFLEHSAGRLTFIHPISKAVRRATAILLSQSIVLTPAHNVYDREGKVFYSNFLYEVGEEEPLGMVDYGLMQDYANANSQKKSHMYDYAVLHLERPVKSIKSLCCTLNAPGKRQQQLTVALEQSQKSAQDSRLKVTSLQQQLQATSIQVQNLREKIDNLKGEISFLAQSNKSLQEQVTLLLSRIDQLTAHKQQDISFNINQSMIKEEIHPKNAINSMEASFSIIQSIVLEESRIAWDLRDASIEQYYEVARDSGSVRCRPIRQTNWNQRKIIACHPMPRKGQLILKAINYTNSNSTFSFGIMTKPQKQGDRAYCLMYQLSNKSNSGSILLNGEIKTNRDCGLYLRKGEKMSMNVDLDKLMVVFRNTQKSETIQLSPISSTAPLFPFLMLWNKGDEVSLTIRPQ